MDNLERIKKAWAMGWSATLKSNYQGKIFPVVAVTYKGILVDTGSRFVPLNLERFEITGYKYAGELAGNEIPEGQRFSVKKGGAIIVFFKGKFQGVTENGGCIQPIKDIDKSEIEPVFT